MESRWQWCGGAGAAAAAAVGCAGCCLRCALSRVRRSSPLLLRAPPDAPGAVGAEWMSSVLRGGPEQVGAAVASVAVQPITAQTVEGAECADGGGLSGSRIVRASLAYAPDAAAGAAAQRPGRPPAPASVIVKWSSNRDTDVIPFLLRLTWAVDGVNAANYFRIEDYFYSRARAELDAAGVRTPRVYSSLLQDATDPHVCCSVCCDVRSRVVHCAVLEDMRGWRTGKPFAHVPTPEAGAALRNIAVLHRSTWNRHGAHAEAIGALVGGSGFCAQARIMFGLRGTNIWKEKGGFAEWSASAGLRKVWGGVAPPGEHPMVGKIRDCFTDAGVLDTVDAARRAWPALLPRLGSVDAQCLVHGDFHHWNHMFHSGEGDAAPECVLLDWQMFGSGRPAYEILYFLVLSRDFTSHDDDDALLRIYHAALTAGGVVEYPLDAFLTDVRLALIDIAVKPVIENSSKVAELFFGPALWEKFCRSPHRKLREIIAGVSTALYPRIFARFAGMHLRHPGLFAAAGAD